MIIFSCVYDFVALYDGDSTEFAPLFFGCGNEFLPSGQTTQVSFGACFIQIFSACFLAYRHLNLLYRKNKIFLKRNHCIGQPYQGCPTRGPRSLLMRPSQEIFNQMSNHLELLQFF